MTVRLQTDRTLTVETESATITRKISYEAYDTLYAHAALLSGAEIVESHSDVSCPTLPRGFRDALSVATQLSERPNGTAGFFREVWLETDCVYSLQLGPKEAEAQQRAETLVLLLRILALEALQAD